MSLLSTLSNKRNILPELYPSEQLRIKKAIAAEWNSKRTAQQKEEDVFYTANDVTEATIQDIVRLAPPKNQSANTGRYRRSERIAVPSKQTAIELVCKNTGIVSTLGIPRIPGFYMEYENPLSSISNCRSIASKGISYLRSLDTQVLAGILIILAEDYNLFSYSPFETGASKNALLRSCGKESLIRAILYIEENIHSENYSSLPRLSFHVDMDVKQSDIEGRIHNWIKLVDDALTAPAILFAPAPILPTAKKISAQKKEIAQKQKEQRKAILSTKKQLEEAKDSVKSLYKDSLLSQKFKNLLLSLLDPNIFPTLASTAKAKIALKLSTLPMESRITALVKLFEAAAKAPTVNVLDDFDFEPSAPQTAKPVLKTAFELQNSPAVIAAQTAAHKAKLAEAQAQKEKMHFIKSMTSLGQSEGTLLLTMDKAKTTGYDSILLNGQPIPEGRFQLAAIREAFAKVRDYKGTAPTVEAPSSIEQSEPSFIVLTDSEIQSMSLLKQAIYRKKLAEFRASQKSN